MNVTVKIEGRSNREPLVVRKSVGEFTFTSQYTAPKGSADMFRRKPYSFQKKVEVC